MFRCHIKHYPLFLLGVNQLYRGALRLINLNDGGRLLPPARCLVIRVRCALCSSIDASTQIVDLDIRKALSESILRNIIFLEHAHI